MGGSTYAGQYASTDQSERTKLGQTTFHNGSLGLSVETTGGVDTGFNREPGGTLNSMTTGCKAYCYLTDAIGSVIGLADQSGTKVNTYTSAPAASPAPPPRRLRSPTGSPAATKAPNAWLHAEGDPVRHSAELLQPPLGSFLTRDPRLDVHT
ncbi:hypothetical protein GCM10010326_01910 [Streptomyces xanthochromogenes]|uniref:Uncharacterized protein n=1 Tax=Streptomyces xanthochromogenes TaxID=67384 RepID=A0ABQ2ZIJ5_9ACTN|nr:hypothetical protein GCM10010326_01910 [Streptomyces xanthochromogenes]